jgi:hypothetical protein
MVEEFMDKLIQAKRGNLGDGYRMRFFIDGKELFYITCSEEYGRAHGHTVTLVLPGSEFEFLDGKD